MSSPSPFVFSQWPPELTDEQKEQLTLAATTYALAHGLLYLPVPAPPPGTAPASAIHAPISLIPAPFPRNVFERVQRLQSIYNTLYSRIALNDEFLDVVMGIAGDIGVSRVDDFTRELWTIWTTVRDENDREGRKRLHLGIFRSDYLLHAPPSSTAPASLKQVEFNTISSSFGALSDRVTNLHRHLLTSTGYLNVDSRLSRENLPDNGATSTIVNGLAAAREAYETTFKASGTWILFVVQANERNVFDQRWLEYELLERFGIHVVRQSLDELHSSATLDQKTRALSIALPSSREVEISTIYFRACYTPNDFKNRSHYETRALLERARAISCPSLALQLSGGKKIQQVLTEPSILENFLLGGNHLDGIKFTQEDADEIRGTWMEMWGLDEPDGVKRALESYNSLVLKPQREGGGNNVYRDSIPKFIESLPEAERAAWVAMRLIEPPTNVGGYLVRAGAGGASTSDAGGAHRADVVSELGIFGWSLFGGDTGSIKQNSGGWLVRTKGRESDEGGVAVGFSVLDSVLLVD